MGPSGKMHSDMGRQQGAITRETREKAPTRIPPSISWGHPVHLSARMHTCTNNTVDQQTSFSPTTAPALSPRPHGIDVDASTSLLHPMLDELHCPTTTGIVQGTDRNGCGTDQGWPLWGDPCGGHRSSKFLHGNSRALGAQRHDLTPVRFGHASVPQMSQVHSGIRPQSLN
jgi:hypothetical protein